MKKLLIVAFIFALPFAQVILFNGTTLAQEETQEEKTEVKKNESGESPLNKFTTGFKSGILSLMYTPVKLGVSMAGGIVGGIAYPLSGFNENVSSKIWDKSLGGSYLITEDILSGEEELELFLNKN